MAFAPWDIIFGAADKVVDVLKGTGIIKTPEDQAKVKETISNIYIKEMQANTDFFKADQTAQDPAWAAGLRASVRPIVTYLFVLMYLYNKIAMMRGWSAVPFDAWDKGLLGTVVGFYFGSRVIEKMTGNDK